MPTIATPRDPDRDGVLRSAHGVADVSEPCDRTARIDQGWIRPRAEPHLQDVHFGTAAGRVGRRREQPGLVEVTP